MKKALALLLALVVLLTLCACGSDDSSQAEVELPKNGKKGPSQDLILQDLESALFQLPNAEVTEVTTVKSLTEDSHYEITLQVSAATTYADWQIECDMSYTKYDQGWMLSDIIWNSKNYVISRIPDLVDMVDHASTILLTHEVRTNYEHILPMEMSSTSMNFSSENNIGSNIITLCWDTTYEELHSKATLHFTSMWQYDPSIDNWSLIYDNDAYCIDYEFVQRIPDYTLDFSGEWQAERSSPTVTLGGYGTIIISNFSWDGFNVYIPGIDEYYDIEPYFLKTNVDTFGTVTFTNSDGHYIEFQPQGEYGTRIKLWLDGTNIAVAEAQVSCKLPSLS